MAKQQSKKSKAKTKQARPAPPWPLLALLGLGLAITGYLTGLAWLDAGPALCNEGSGCDLIQNSRYSTVLGLPLAFWGFLIYALMTVIALNPSAPTKRWSRLWHLAVIGVAISLYLTVVGVVELEAACIWCLASLVTMTSIFALLAWQRPAANKEPVWWHRPLNSAVLALIVIGLLHVYYYSDLLQPPPAEKLEALAEHLDDSRAQFYGASWCAACQQQKWEFREAAKHLPYIECSPSGRGGPTALACAQENINSFPTWIIDGQRYEGVLEPEELARHSGFDW